MIDRVDTGLLRRAAALSLGVLVVLGVLAGRIFAIQTVDFERYQDKVIEQMTTESPADAGRGEIYDAGGKLLATNITTYRVILCPSAIASAQRALDKKATSSISEHIADALSEILSMDRDTIYQKAQKSTRLDETVMRNVDETTAAKVRKLILDEGLDNLVCLEATGKRYYPEGSLASHVLGFTGADGIGLYGLEYQYNDALDGTDGYYVTARDSRGDPLPESYRSYVAPVDGLDLTLTIDSYVQAALEEQVENAAVVSGALNRACGIVMNVNTGAILAMAVYPGYDLNDPWELPDYYKDKLSASGLVEGSEEYSALAGQYLLEAWSNKALTETYIPGSTFKMVTASMALEKKLPVLSSHVFCGGSKTVLGRCIHCHKRKGHGSLSFSEGIQQSCNVWFMTLGQALGITTFSDYYRLFGYREKTGIDLPGEGMGVISSAMTELDLSIYAFGQNFTVTAIQHIRAIAAVANGGTLVTPYLVERMSDSEGETVYQHENTSGRTVIDAETSETMNAILAEGVAGEGGAKNAYVAGYRVAAKTGTSEKKGATTTGTEMYICSCVGYAPAEDPEVAMIIMVDEPSRGILYGSTVAAPYIANTFETVLPYLGIEPIYTEAEAEAMAKNIPSYIGLPAEHAAAYAENRGFEVEVIGDGAYITGQSPRAGESYSGNTGRLVLYAEADSTEDAVAVPNVLGMSVKDANVALSRAGLNIKLTGAGAYDSQGVAVAVEQSTAAGEKVPRGTVITVTFYYTKITE